jgi:hypothetical protein
VTLTALQLRESPPSGQLLFGRPTRTVPGNRGPIALFEPGAVFAYLFDASYRRSLYVVRAPRGLEPSLARVPGTHPRVVVLLELHSRTAIRKACRLVDLLRAGERDPSHLSDGSWARLAAVFAARRPSRALLTCLRQGGLS